MPFCFRLRLLIILLLIALVWPGKGAETTPSAPTEPAHEEQVTQTPSPATPDTPPSYHINFGDFTISTEKMLTIHGKDNNVEGISADGNVKMTMPFIGVNDLPVTFYIFARKLQITRNGVAMGKPDQKNPQIAQLNNAIITTCALPPAHHHYELRAGKLIIFQDKRYIASNVAIRLAGFQLLSLPRFTGSLDPATESENTRPSFTAGTSTIDGTYIGGTLAIAPNLTDTLVINARIGTKRLIRGLISWDRPLTFTESNIKGVLSLLVSSHEDVQNRLIAADELADERLRNLTISRQPAFQFSLNNVQPPVNIFRNFRLRFGGGIGHYFEDPTKVSQWRGQTWGVLTSPHYRVAGLNLYGEVGARFAMYIHSIHATYATQVTIETRKSAPIYAHVSLLHRRSTGFTPFLFDRVLIPDELYAEVEFPLGHQSPWHLNIANRQDMIRHKSRSIPITLSLSDDCLSYGVTYDPIERETRVGLIINGISSFRKGYTPITFTQ